MGNTDKTIRIILAVVILYFASALGGMAAIALTITAGILIFTALLSFCPLYALFNISSCKKRTS